MPPNKTAQVVIGAQFGDEGKGRVTDQLAAEADGNIIVVRFNGGAQAGHTVVTPEGRCHVFSHIGSGAFVGAATFLSRFFVSNPILFLKEIEVLATKGVRPTVYIDPASPLTTPYDMMINQIIERERGADRHGSCGIGFGETLERNLNPDYALTVGDLTDLSLLSERLDAIRREYIPTRLTQLGVGQISNHDADLFQSNAILEHFIEDAHRFVDMTTITDAQEIMQNRRILFEGAQGLLLDQDRGFFPHVTRSNTGLKNVLELVTELSLERLDVNYVTRAYLTRHGAGPLPHELPRKPYPNIIDETNVINDYQGTLRFAWLDLDLLGQAIVDDLSDAHHFPELSVNTRLAISCLDQIGNMPVTYYQNGQIYQNDSNAFLAAVLKSTESVSELSISTSLRRNSIRKIF